MLLLLLLLLLLLYYYCYDYSTKTSNMCILFRELASFPQIFSQIRKWQKVGRTSHRLLF